MTAWPRPEASIRRAVRLRGAALADRSAQVAGTASIRGPVWIGAGRAVAEAEQIAGPAVLWDDPASATTPDDVAWQDIEPSSLASRGDRPARARIPPGKRAFDIVFSLVALAVTAPLYPIIAAAIVAEDGFPVFFAHRRETVGGRDFPCLKFRSMARSAENAKRPLESANRCDGPQFFVPDDPRVTRVGRVLRRLHLDELPQFLNVLAGHMSVVGPRPSPYRENQYCPAWREARLSVRPGVTGLWQVSRTRAAGRDFQEWIRYDLTYVAESSWALDLKIIARTIGLVAGGAR
jgi:lipopolysaccharide/colanic/teichoic acid biosynthesis glycosyltransferase